MQNLASNFNVDAVIGPFVVDGIEVRPTFRGEYHPATNPKHWTIVINQHTEKVLKETIEACARDLKTVSAEDAVKILHERIHAARGDLTDEYNGHNFDLHSVELSIPDQGISVKSAENAPQSLAVFKNDAMEFWHTHDPEMAPYSELHKHDVELTIAVANDRFPPETLRELSETMSGRLQDIADAFFADGQTNFTNVTLELATQRLFDKIVETIPELAYEGGDTDYLKSVGILVKYEGDHDHPNYHTEFVRTLDAA